MIKGFVVEVKRIGVLAQLDGLPETGDIFKIYRIINDIENIIGTGYIRKQKGLNIFKINPMDNESKNRGNQFIDVKIGDLLNSI
jgi:hypothetical protein